MSFAKWSALAALVVGAVVVQAAVLRHVSVEGVVPNLALILVVVAAISRGPEFATGFGFVAGLLVDVAPPADQVAGRWALALALVGFLAGRVRADARASAMTAVVVTALASFLATSLYALTGVLVGDLTFDPAPMLRVIVISVLWDLFLAPLLIPLLLRTMDALRPPRVLI